MAIDTENKRRSVHGYTLNCVGPVPDGSVDNPDRAHTAWYYSGFTYSVIVSYVGGPFWPPHPEDIRVVTFLNNQGVTLTRGIDYEFRWALAKDMSITEQAALTVSVDDMWLLYKEVNNLDESAPFSFPV